MGHLRKKVPLIFCLLFLGVPISLLSLWRIKKICLDKVVLPTQPLILEHLNLWALNARPFLRLKGNIVCADGVAPQLTAQFSFDDGTMAQLRSHVAGAACGQTVEITLESNNDFPQFKYVQRLVLMSSVPIKGARLVWYNAHP